MSMTPSTFKTSRTTRGFTLMELIVVIAIIVILMALLLVGLMKGKESAKIGAATIQVNAIELALNKYAEHFGAFPPDKTPSAVTGENLWYYLDRKIVIGETSFGPNLDIKEDKLLNNGTYKEILSPLGGHYEYQLVLNANGDVVKYIVIDPGLDKKLGGTLNATTGWTQTGPDAADNIMRMGPN